MKAHVQGTLKLFEHVDFPWKVAPILRHHHERYDGTGYPRKLAGSAIPLGARIFSVADTLDVMTSDRPYRKALSYEQARAEIARFSGVQFDPEVVKCFLRVPLDMWTEIRASTHRSATRSFLEMNSMAAHLPSSGVLSRG